MTYRPGNNYKFLYSQFPGDTRRGAPCRDTCGSTKVVRRLREQRGEHGVSLYWDSHAQGKAQ